jgi:hypothetical protein
MPVFPPDCLSSILPNDDEDLSAFRLNLDCDGFSSLVRDDRWGIGDVEVVSIGPGLAPLSRETFCSYERDGGGGGGGRFS